MYTIYTLKWITGSCFSWSHPPLWTHSHGWISSLPWKHRRRAPHDEGSQSTRQNGDLEHLPLSRPGWKLMILPVFALGRCRLAPWHLGRPKKVPILVLLSFSLLVVSWGILFVLRCGWISWLLHDVLQYSMSGFSMKSTHSPCRIDYCSPKTCFQLPTKSHFEFIFLYLTFCSKRLYFLPTNNFWYKKDVQLVRTS